MPIGFLEIEYALRVDTLGSCIALSHYLQLLQVIMAKALKS